MFLLILSTNPREACNLLPQKIRFKQLIELSQLICSCGISNVYKPVKQGKELQEWILKNKYWVYMYYSRLFFWVLKNTNIKPMTVYNLTSIKNDLMRSAKFDNPIITTAIFRYSKGYECMTKYKTNTELPIRECIKEYKKYVEWKKLKGVRGYV